MRINRDEYFMKFALVASLRATCPRLSVGCVIVKEDKIVSTGYNGSIHSHDHCIDVGCLLTDSGRCVRTLHAELNAVLHADRDKLQGATAYVTHECCENCMKTLNQAGIKRIVYLHPYYNKLNVYFAEGMSVEQLVTNFEF